MMHDMNILDIGGSDAEYVKGDPAHGRDRISGGGLTRTPGSLSFDDLSAGEQLAAHHTGLSWAIW